MKLKKIPIYVYIIILVIAFLAIRFVYLTNKANNIINALNSESVYHIELQASDGDFKKLYTEEFVGKDQIESIISGLKKFDGRIDTSRTHNFDSKHGHFVVVLNDDERGVFIHITSRSYMDIQYYDKVQGTYSDRYTLHGKWQVDDLDDLFGINDLILDYDSEIYDGRELTIGMVGKSPVVRESQVTFYEISLLDLLEDDLDKYDAIFIGREYLEEASKHEYVKRYKEIEMPIFYIEAYSSLSPFTIDSYSHRDSNYIDNYAIGLNYQKHLMEDYSFKLHYNIENKENIEDVYSRIFITIEEILQTFDK